MIEVPDPLEIEPCFWPQPFDHQQRLRGRPVVRYNDLEIIVRLHRLSPEHSFERGGRVERAHDDRDVHAAPVGKG